MDGHMRFLYISVPFFVHPKFRWVYLIRKPKWTIWNINGGAYCHLKSGEVVE